MANITVSGTTTTARGTTGNDVFDGTNGFINGNISLLGGAGDDAYYALNGVTVVELAGEGFDTIVSGNSYKLPDNVEVLFAWGSSAAVGNDLNNHLFGGAPATFMNGGRGDDLLSGGGGADTYQFDAASGRDTIVDWNGASRIRLAGYDQFSNFQDVKLALSQVGNTVVLRLDANNSVTLNNTVVSQLKAENFQYVVDLSDYKMSTSFSDDFNAFSIYQPSLGLNGHWDLWGSGSNAVTAHTLQSNNEKQLYVDPTFAGRGSTQLGLNPYSIQDGALVITASPIAQEHRSALYDYQFQSGAITTTGTFAQQYGYFEARLMLPTAPGTWPAFWLMRADGQWPPELDIMEAWNDTSAVQTLHTSEKGAHMMTSSSTWVPDGDTAYHNYGLLWTPEKLVWMLDGVEVYSKPTPADMHSPMYMIINLAVTGAVNDPNFTEQLKVDHVRVYALDEPLGGASSVGMGPVAGMRDGFNITYYKANNPDVVAAGIDPQYHYETAGKREGRLAYEGATALKMPVDLYMGKIEGMPEGFNPDYYAKQNPDVVRAGADLLQHYKNFGKAEGRLPFDPTDVLAPGESIYLGERNDQPFGINYVYYVLSNPDVVAAKVNLQQHYATYGIAEGRLAFDSNAVSTPPVVTSPPVVMPPVTPPVVTPPVVTPPVVTPPVVTPPVVTPPVVTPPVVTPPVVTPPVVTPPVVTPPVVTPPVVTPPVVTPPVVTPPVVTPPVVTPPVVTPPVTTPPVTAPHGYWGAMDAAHDGFNLEYYRTQNPDVVAARVDPLQHYILHGKAEGRLPYDPAAAPASANWGKVAGAVDGFNAEYYTTHNPDVVLSGMNPLTHYLEHGKAEGRLPYNQATPAAPGVTPPAPESQAMTFDAAYYALHNPDVMMAKMDPLFHYQNHGKAEGRLSFDDGSGKNVTIGTSGDDILTGTSTKFEVLTGGAGKDVFKFAPGMGWDTVTDFTVGQDKLDASALFQAYGAPKISDLSWTTGSIAQFSGGESIVLLGVTAAQAQLVVLG